VSHGRGRYYLSASRAVKNGNSWEVKNVQAVQTSKAFGADRSTKHQRVPIVPKRAPSPNDLGSLNGLSFLSDLPLKNTTPSHMREVVSNGFVLVCHTAANLRRRAGL